MLSRGIPWNMFRKRFKPVFQEFLQFYKILEKFLENLRSSSEIVGKFADVIEQLGNVRDS